MTSDEGPVLVTRNDLMAGILVGIGGEHDTPPTMPQLERTADLIIRYARKREAGLDQLAKAISALPDVSEGGPS